MKRAGALSRDYMTGNILDVVDALARRVRALEAAVRDQGGDTAAALMAGPTADGSTAPLPLYLVNEETGQWYRLVARPNEAGLTQLYMRPIVAPGEVA
jgi:hypothetical protein